MRKQLDDAGWLGKGALSEALDRLEGRYVASSPIWPVPSHVTFNAERTSTMIAAVERATWWCLLLDPEDEDDENSDRSLVAVVMSAGETYRARLADGLRGDGDRLHDDAEFMEGVAYLLASSAPHSAERRYAANMRAVVPWKIVVEGEQAIGKTLRRSLKGLDADVGKGFFIDVQADRDYAAVTVKVIARADQMELAREALTGLDSEAEAPRPR